jgi:hypothetical protein
MDDLLDINLCNTKTGEKKGLEDITIKDWEILEKQGFYVHYELLGRLISKELYNYLKGKENEIN